MLSEKQFRERAKVELRQIGDQVASLASDRDIYWKFEREVIAHNPELQNPNAFVDMVRGAYADAMAARTVRLLDNQVNGPSLPRILSQIADYPQLLHDKVSEREFAGDRASLQQASDKLRGLLDSHFAHHERTPSALASTHRALDAAIDAMIATLKTYYWAVAEGQLDLGVKYPDDPLAIFRQPWLGPGPGQ
jgi:hypothetical protein